MTPAARPGRTLPLRRARGALVGLVGAVLAVAGHGAGGGAVVVPLVPLVVAGAVLACVVAASSRWTPARLVLALAGIQGARSARAAAVLVAAAVALLSSALLAPPASAHDELVSVTPDKGAVLDAAPTEVVLVFSEEVEQLGATVVATAGDGSALSDGTPVVDGPKVTQALLPVANATTVTVKYRIVSSDGHPVSGSWTFDVDIPTSLPPSPSSGPASSTPSASATDVSAAPVASAADGGSGSVVPWVLAGIAAVAVAVAAASGRRARRG